MRAIKRIIKSLILTIIISPLNMTWGETNTSLNLLEKNILENKFTPGQKQEIAFLNVIKDNINKPEKEKLKIINDFVNQNIRYATDWEAWGKEDYWSAPLELFNNGSGDCEDFAIAKYYALQKLGIDGKKLKLVYVQYIEKKDGPIIPHMVLSYNQNEEVLVLDNLIREIKNSNERPDLKPVFSFNDEGIYKELNGAKMNRTLSKWQDVILKSKKEGW